MKQKVFTFKKLTPNSKIRITSENECIDFFKEITHIAYKFDEKEEETIEIGAKMIANNQASKTILEIPFEGENALITIKTDSNYDIDKVMILLR